MSRAASLRVSYAVLLFVLYAPGFFIWYAFVPPQAGREKKGESGDTPAPPAMGLRPPAPPLFACLRRDEKKKEKAGDIPAALGHGTAPPGIPCWMATHRCTRWTKKEQPLQIQRLLL